jgi:TolB-like protein/tetratricopeptide (TPR) repeat protein
MSILAELKRRNVFKVGAAYAVVAWLLVQVIVAIEAPLNLPDWFDTVAIVLLAIGFPIAVLLAWAYEVTPEGIKPTSQVEPGQSITRATGQKLNYVVIGLLATACGFLIVDNYVLDDTDDVLPNSIAVLPLENLSPDPEHSYFAPGIHDAILSELAKIADVNVIARTSVLKYADSAASIADIARELKVQTVMEGSVQFAEGRVLVTAQLIDPATEAHIWTGDYNMEFKDVFAIEADIAKKIASALEVKLLPNVVASIDRPLTTSTEAYQWYLKERELPFFEEYPDTVPTHVAYLDQAIAIDPEFAAAHAWKSMARSVLPDAKQEARASAERAVALDPKLGLGYLALAWVEELDGNYDDARRAYQRGVEASPNDAKILIEFARFLARDGDQARAVRMAERALELAPNGYDVLILYGQVLLFDDDAAGAAAAFRRATEIGPAFAGSFEQLMSAELMLGHRDAALTNLERAEALWADPPTWGISALTYANGRLGRQAEAERYAGELLARVRNGAPGVDLSNQLEVALGLEDRARVRSILTEIVETCPDCALEHGRARHIKANFWRDPILDEPEFVALRERIRID